MRPTTTSPVTDGRTIFQKKKPLRALNILYSKYKLLAFFLVLSHLVASWAVFLDNHLFRMFLFVPGSDVIFFAAGRTLESDLISHSFPSSHNPCPIIAQIKTNGQLLNASASAAFNAHPICFAFHSAFLLLFCCSSDSSECTGWMGSAAGR